MPPIEAKGVVDLPLGSHGIRRNLMFEVSEKATETIKKFFKDNNQVSPIRIIVSGGG